MIAVTRLANAAWPGSHGLGRTFLLAMCVSVASGACSSGQSAPSAAFDLRDSAGITIAINHGSTAPLIGSAVVAGGQEVLELEEEFGLRIVFPLGDTALFLAGGSLKGLVSVDRRTGIRHSIGSAGDGPGEYRLPQALGRCAGDTLLVHSYPARLTMLSASGEFIRLLERPPLRRTVVGFARDCSAVLMQTVVSDHLPQLTRGRVGPRYDFLWYTPETDSTALLTSVRGAEEVLAELHGVQRPVTVPYGNYPSEAAHGDLLFVGTGNLPEIRVFDRLKGLVRIIRWEAEADPVEEADRASYDRIRSTLDEQFGQGVMAEFLPSAAFELPSHKPLYAGMRVSEDGKLWVQKYPEIWEGYEQIFRASFTDHERQWWVFSPEGQLLGLYATPPHFYVHAITEDVMSGVRRDQDDLDHVMVLPLVAALRDSAVGRGR